MMIGMLHKEDVNISVPLLTLRSSPAILSEIMF